MFQINWKLKSFFYKVFGLLELKSTFYLIQKYITHRSKVKIDNIDKSWTLHLNSIKENNLNNLLELGAGKSLEQNIYFSYALNNKLDQTVIDINKMLDFELFNEASLQISKILNTKKKKTVKSVIDIRENYNIIYKAPANLENLIQEKKKFDICINTTTLEHLTIDDLRYSLKHLKNLIKNKGFISSAIDYSDHYSHTDKKITSLNFLKFSNAEWKKYNNKYLFQNRLRHYDYKRLFEENGFVISKVTTGPKEFPKVKIAKEFDEKNKETFITWGYFLIQNN